MDRRSVLHLLMLGTALCPAVAWQQGVAWVADVGDPMIHLFCQLLAAWFMLKRERGSPIFYLLLAPFAAWDLLSALTGEMNVPATQIAYVPLLTATALWGLWVTPSSAFEED